LNGNVGVMGETGARHLGDGAVGECAARDDQALIDDDGEGDFGVNGVADLCGAGV
jgi:hypothetical protein